MNTQPERVIHEEDGRLKVPIHWKHNQYAILAKVKIPGTDEDYINPKGAKELVPVTVLPFNRRKRDHLGNLKYPNRYKSQETQRKPLLNPNSKTA